MKSYDAIEDKGLGQVEEPMNTRYENNPVLDLSLRLSIELVEYCELLENERKFVIARQLLRSGTSIGANSREAQNAESTKHFISKFKIALREVDETEYWLEICEQSRSYPSPPPSIISKLNQISKIINKIISTTNQKLNR